VNPGVCERSAVPASYKTSTEIMQLCDVLEFSYVNKRLYRTYN
jgi:hypothetical protein